MRTCAPVADCYRGQTCMCRLTFLMSNIRRTKCADLTAQQLVFSYKLRTRPEG